MFSQPRSSVCPTLSKKGANFANRPIAGTFGEARALYEADLAANHTLKETGKLYRRKDRLDEMPNTSELPCGRNRVARIIQETSLKNTFNHDSKHLKQKSPGFSEGC
jgi:hypothetical protein